MTHITRSCRSDPIALSAFRYHFSLLTHNKIMKKTAFAVISAIFLLICSFALSSCTAYDETFTEISENYYNVADKATFSARKGSSDCEITVDFGKTQTFNRLVLREKTNSVLSFSLRLPASLSPFYGNDFIGRYRYCSFPAVTTDKLVISVKSDTGWELDRIEAYYIPLSDAPFDTTAYITAKSAYSLSHSANAPVDTFNIIYSAYLDKNAEIRLPSYYIDDVKISGEDILSGSVQNIRKTYPRAKILVTVLGDREFDGDGLSLQQRHSLAFSRKEVLSANLIRLIEDHSLDGVSFDYEFPLTEEDYRIFADFSLFFSQTLPESKLFTAAVAAWCVDEKRLSPSALSCFDRVTLMAYDDPDERGCHSTFYTAFSQLKRVKAKGLPLSGILLGIPLYSKPLDGSSFAVPYSECADSIPMFSNCAIAENGGEEKLCYFNGRQLVADKTSLALDLGLAGVAVWHYSLDSQDPALSLIQTIRRTVYPRAL